MTIPLITDEDEIAAVNVESAVARGADSPRKLAIYFHVPADDGTFTAALDTAQTLGMVRFSEGCCGGSHNPNCELEIIK